MTVQTIMRAVTLAGALAAVPAATASAATVTLSESCYLQVPGGASEPIAANVTGLGAGQAVTMKVSRGTESAGTSGPGTADASGNLGLNIGTWFVSLGSKPSKEVGGTVDVLDAATGQVVGSAPTSLANLTYDVTKVSGRIHRWKVQGLAALTGQTTYYAHYFNHGKYKGRQKLGKASGNCGYLNVKKPLTPFRKVGRYDVAIEALKKYDKDAPKFTGRVVVTTKYG